MPRPRERDPSDKIKGKGGGRVQKDARRQLTAKFRKELAQRKRGGAENYEAQAVDQTEEVTAAAIEEVVQQAGRGGQRASTALQKHWQEKQHQRRKEAGNGQRQAPASPAQDSSIMPTGTTRTPDTPMIPAATGGRSNAAMPQTNGTAPVPPTPQERMRQKLVEERREQAGQRQAPVLPQGNDRPGHSPYYGGSSATTNIPKENRALENQSINQSIKERPRRSTGPKEKPPGGAFVPKTRKSVEQAVGKAAAPVKASAATGKASATKKVTERARKKAQREAQRKMLQRSQKAAKSAADLSKRAVMATVNAVKALISGLVALVGGGVLVAALCVIILIAAIIASPFGILFSNEPSRDAVPLNAAVSQINMELTDRLADLQAGEYDTIDIQGQIPNWREVVAVFAAKTSGADDGVDVAALTPDRVDRLRTVFWDMCGISAQTEDIDHPATGSAEAWTEKKLTITITAKTAEDMRTAYSFSDFQNQALTELLAELDTLGVLLDDLSVSQEAALALYRSLPDDLDPERRAVIKAACSLVGKVNYFWGGKSLVIGWDSRWGTLQKVWAEGSPTTGTYRPYGLDCSGFADWVFYNASGSEYIIGHGGGAASQHTYCTAIQWDEARPGDLVFYPDDEHVGIVGGRDEAGELLVIHCASGANNVVITSADGFTSIGRPVYFSE